MSPLESLIPHSQLGGLLPARQAVTALGLTSETQLPQSGLVEGLHFIRLSGSDRRERIYYSLEGLLQLADLVQTLPAQQLKQDILRRQSPPGGSLIPGEPAAVQAIPTDLTDLAVPRSAVWVDAPITPSDPAYAVAHYLQPGLEPAVRRSAAPGATPQETAAMIFEAQRLAGEQIFQGQRLAHQSAPSELHVEFGWLNRVDSWLSRQEVWAVGILAALVMALLGIGSYLIVSSIRPAPPSPTTIQNR